MSDLFVHAAAKERPARTPHAAAAKAEVTEARDHVCVVCGVDCGFGFGVSMRFGRAGRWSCLEHRDQVERMPG